MSGQKTSLYHHPALKKVKKLGGVSIRKSPFWTKKRRNTP